MNLRDEQTPRISIIMPQQEIRLSENYTDFIQHFEMYRMNQQSTVSECIPQVPLREAGI
jgi:hypothetical protein